MKFSYTWLRELVPGLKMDVTTLAQQITMKTAECEGVHDPGAFAGASVAAVARAENSEPDSIIEIDNKSLTNRPDLWGHLGMAREVAAIAGLDAVSPQLAGRKPDQQSRRCNELRPVRTRPADARL